LKDSLRKPRDFLRKPEAFLRKCNEFLQKVKGFLKINMVFYFFVAYGASPGSGSGSGSMCCLEVSVQCFVVCFGLKAPRENSVKLFCSVCSVTSHAAEPSEDLEEYEGEPQI
jgi:hypothetical protein